MAISVISLILSTVISGFALAYARRADDRAREAEARAVRAERRAVEAHENDARRFRIDALDVLFKDLHDLARSEQRALGGDLAAAGTATRIRQRLPASLSGVSGVALPACEAVATGSHVFQPNGGPDGIYGMYGSYGQAMAEVRAVIASEQKLAAERHTREWPD